MRLVVNVNAATTQLSRLLQRVSRGDEIVFVKDGEPMAILSPYHQSPARRKPGSDAGNVILTEAFDDPLSDFENQ